MTSLQGIQASSWSHVHVTPDVMLASVYLALCGIAYDTPPGDARCVCQFSIELCGPGAGLPCSSPTSGVPCSHGKGQFGTPYVPYFVTWTFSYPFWATVKKHRNPVFEENPFFESPKDLYPSRE